MVDRDGGIGDLKMKSLCDAMEISRRLILVLTKSYLDSADCLREAHYLTGQLNTSIIHGATKRVTCNIGVERNAEN